MTLSQATLSDGAPIALRGDAPYPAEALLELRGVSFDLPCGDPWILANGTPGHAYLEGAHTAWGDHPEWMDFLDPASPCHREKALERDLYLHAWRGHLDASRVLDVGCGIGRFTTVLLDAGASVWGVDADLEALRRCAWHSAGRAGRLDLSWSTAERLPEVEVDLAIACELLCYVPDPERALAAIVDRLPRGGVLLASVEARWGWAASADAAPDTIEAALGGPGLVDVRGDRFVRTFEREAFYGLLVAAGLAVERLEATHYTLGGPLERVIGERAIHDLIRIEEACRAHSVWGPLNRAWTAVARKR